jgi:hypothetical protein
MAINEFIHPEVIKKGLNYFLDTTKIIVLCLRNDNGDATGINNGKVFTFSDGIGELGGFFGFSYYNNTTVDIWETLEAEYTAENVGDNFVTLSFKPIDPLHTTIVVSNDAVSAGNNEVKYFALLELAKNDINDPGAVKLLLIYPLEHSLTLNDGSKFSFSNFTITNSLITT